jgi:hypothetical protein
MFRLLTLTLAAALFLLAGCGPTFSQKVALYELTGNVTREGKPVKEGGIIFIPESGSWGGMVVNAAVIQDGTYKATTSRTTGTATVIDDGAPVGRFKVVYHPPSDGQRMGLETELPDIIEVKEGSNVFNLELPTKIPQGVGEKRDDH